jgi:CRISPR/Cas system-associated endonuclease Cas1
MPTLYLTHDNGLLGRKGTALTWGERSGTKSTIPASSVEDVVVLGNGSVSTQAIRLLLEQDVPLHSIERKRLVPGKSFFGKKQGRNLRKKQEECAASPDAALPVARGCVVGKILNQRKKSCPCNVQKPEKPGHNERDFGLAYNASLAGTAPDVRS